MRDIVAGLQEPLTLQLREVVSRVPVGMQHLRLETSVDDWLPGAMDQLVVTLRARVLAAELAPATVPFHEERLQRQTITVRRRIERPWRRWDALRLAFGVPAHRVEWVEASWTETLEVFVPIVCDHEIVIDREAHFPEAQVQFPERLGRAVLWEQVREP